MASTTLTTFVIGLMFSSMVVLGLVPFMSNMGITYGRTFDNSSFEVYNKMQNLSDISSTAQEQFKNINAQSSWYDVLGALASQGSMAVKTITVSVDVALSMISSGAAEFGLSTTVTPLTSIVVFYIFVTIGLAMFIKSERI